MGPPAKACAVVIRAAGSLEILAFKHPLAGYQLVKGTIEAGETPQEAAVRELREEAGFDSRVVADLGEWNSSYMGQVWSLSLCVPLCTLPENWVHRTSDDGGHDFRFFWHSLAEKPLSGWHEDYVKVLDRLRAMSLNKSANTSPQLQAATLPLVLWSDCPQS